MLRAVEEAPVNQHAAAVFLAECADPGADRRLVVAGAHVDAAERALEVQPAKALDERLGVERTGAGDAGGDRLEADVADERGGTGRDPEAAALGAHEGLVLRTAVALAGIADHEPSFGCVLAEGVEVFGVTRERIHHQAVPKQAAGVAFARERQEDPSHRQC